MVLGDFLGHHYQREYLRYSTDKRLLRYHIFVIKTFAFLQRQLRSLYGASVPIYSVLGNNDSFGGTSCKTPNYCMQRHGGFFKMLAHIWGISEPSFKLDGFYSVDIPDSNIRILGLNTVLFSDRIRGYRVIKMVSQELGWFKSQLVRAKRYNKQVWLLMHIPPGISVPHTLLDMHHLSLFWRSRFSKAFLDDLTYYHHMKVFMFSGHLHMDGFRFPFAQNGTRIIDSYVPSISPIYGNNPAFKVYEFNYRTGIVENFQTYYVPLNKAKLKWQKEYDFKQAYDPTCKGQCSLHKMLFKANKTIFSRKPNEKTKQYLRFYTVSAQKLSYLYKMFWNPMSWCAMFHLDAVSYKKCISKDAPIKH
jgi:sphingomyelin phosphodiesterase acid-like 3